MFLEAVAEMWSYRDEINAGGESGPYCGIQHGQMPEEERQVAVPEKARPTSMEGLVGVVVIKFG